MWPTHTYYAHTPCLHAQTQIHRHTHTNTNKYTHTRMNTHTYTGTLICACGRKQKLAFYDQYEAKGRIIIIGCIIFVVVDQKYV